MKNIIKNFWVTLSRFKVASTLNILGLSVAFTILMVIGSHLWWEYSFNRAHDPNEQVYVVGINNKIPGFSNSGYATYIARPFAENICNSSPEVEAYCALWTNWATDFTVEGSDKIYTHNMSYVSPTFAEIMNLEMVAGDFTAIDKADAAVIPLSMARTIWGENYLSAINEVIINVDYSYEVVGIYRDMPDNTLLGSTSVANPVLIDIWDMNLESVTEWSYNYFVKLRQGASPEAVVTAAMPSLIEFTKSMFSLSDQEIQEITAELEGSAIKLFSFTDSYFGGEFSQLYGGNSILSLTLLVIALLVLIIAVINYINFFMVLVPIRIRGVNINKVFGAPVAALRANIIGEAVGIMLLAFSLSLLIFYILSNTFISELVSSSLAFEDNLTLLLYALCFAVLVGIFAGLFPAYYITKFSPTLTLKGSFGRSKRGQRYRTVLTSFQFVISIALIIASLFVVLQNNFMMDYDYGFKRNRLITADIGGLANNPTTLKNRLMENNAIENIAFGDGNLMEFGMRWGRSINGESATIYSFPASWDFPELMGMEIVDGRTFIELDATKANGTTIVNETAAKMYNIEVGDTFIGHSDSPADVVGIVKDFNYRSLQSKIEPMCIYEFGSDGWRAPSTMYLRVAHGANITEVMKSVERVIEELSPQRNPDTIEVNFFDKQLANIYQKEQNTSLLITIFAIIAVLISLVGVFGMVIFETFHRRKEIALRKIYGSTVSQLLRRMLRGYIVVIIVSAAIAIPLAWLGVSWWLEGYAYRTELLLWVFVAAVAIISLIVVSTVILQTYKAATQNPIDAIRNS